MIKFGTSGWRAVMGEEFTFQNVRIVVQAIINNLKKKFPQGNISVIVNYDTRFLSERYAFEAAKILSNNKIHVYLSERDAPSQAQALQLVKRGAKGGINFTASFNPPEYNGLKFNTETGAPALPEETDKIEEEIKLLSQTYSFTPLYPKTDFIEKIDEILKEGRNEDLELKRKEIAKNNSWIKRVNQMMGIIEIKLDNRGKN